MKRYFFLLFILFFFNFNIISETKTIINNSNEYGGKTEEIIYDENDENYTKYSIDKKITYFDSNNIQRKLDLIYTQKYTEEKNVLRAEFYYDKKGIKLRMELFYTDDNIRFDRYVTRYNKKGEVIDQAWYKKKIRVQ